MLICNNSEWAVLAEFEAAFLAIAKERADAIVIQEDAVFVSNMSSNCRSRIKAGAPIGRE